MKKFKNLKKYKNFFILGLLEHGLLVKNKKNLALAYIKSPTFVFDVLSLIPTEILIPIFGIFKISYPIVRLNRLLRYGRVLEFVERMETQTKFPNAFRIVILVVQILVLIHWNGCIFFEISKQLGNFQKFQKISKNFQKFSKIFKNFQKFSKIFKNFKNFKNFKKFQKFQKISKIFKNFKNFQKFQKFQKILKIFKSDNWTYDNTREDEGLLRQYIYSFYWSTLQLTIISRTAPPQRTGEYVLETIDFMIGVLIFATIIGIFKFFYFLYF